MFTRGRPLSIVPIDAALAQRLSIVPEVDTPSSKASFLEVPRIIVNKTRPLSEVTEIYSDEDDNATEYYNDHHEDNSSEDFEDEINSEYDDEHSDHSSEGSEIEEGQGDDMVYQVCAKALNFELSDFLILFAGGYWLATKQLYDINLGRRSNSTVKQERFTSACECSRVM
jgi:hypothetical protein